MEKRSYRLYPDYIGVVGLAAFVILELVLAGALLFPAKVGRAIDFAAQFQPRPEWYFLWLYQLVRYFPGRLAFFGAVLLPLAFVLLLILMPYLDRGAKGRMRAVIAGGFLLLLFLVLTLLPVLEL